MQNIIIINRINNHSSSFYQVYTFFNLCLRYFRIILINNTRKKLEPLLQSARNKGDLATIKKILTIFAIVNGYTYNSISEVLQVSKEKEIHLATSIIVSDISNPMISIFGKSLAMSIEIYPGPDPISRSLPS